MNDTRQQIDDFKKEFIDHEISVIYEGKDVKRYKFQKPGTWQYGFYLTCADNLIAMNGDCYSLMIEPGYNRPGLSFLRCNACNTGYFLEKCRLDGSLREFKAKYALEDMKWQLEQEYITKDIYAVFEEDMPDEDGMYGEVKYRELCSDLEIDEPPAGLRLTTTTIMQLAGLETFVEAYEVYESEKATPWKRDLLFYKTTKKQGRVARERCLDFVSYWGIKWIHGEDKLQERADAPIKVEDL